MTEITQEAVSRYTAWLESGPLRVIWAGKGMSVQRGDLSQANILVRFRPGVVGERQRVVHQVVVDLDAVDLLSPVLITRCGVDFGPGQAERLDGIRGMPCEACILPNVPSPRLSAPSLRDEPRDPLDLSAPPMRALAARSWPPALPRPDLLRDSGR